ncbi:20S-pre-rRNA D-site endonuclease nob1 [Tolypocladium ophioglossoides CBS 100239]|uniref:20S-pre-rRNA D-site endonuclease NOB1 n=1 Tax=Tolypocladium ophioglossoides (strain CBS 100239) TaxID=1163406 RepID=A0A0L0NCF0_TOLOC|nr:20S-pre-rRNA D-site endonuclease nob1 [Tolypocladium ophioglossoides CBS 100239]
MATPPTEPSSGAPAPSTLPTASTSKPIHSLILDTGPLIKNDPPASVLVARAEKLYTLPCIIPEIRDAATRARVETTLLPFVTIRSPRPESVKFVQAFARRTGDLEVLSRPDLEVLALGYELECERNGGDWRLRNTPGQKGLNGRPNQASGPAPSQKEMADLGTQEVQGDALEQPSPDVSEDSELNNQTPVEQPFNSSLQSLDLNKEGGEATNPEVAQWHTPSIQESAETVVEADGETADETTTAQELEDDSDDEDGWITPSNVKKHQAKDAGTAIPAQPAQKTLQAAILTSDYAMENVALRMNLNLVTPSLARITHLKNWVLRCHGCFQITKDMGKQFCPSCGQPTLTRTSCTTDEHGNFRVHLKRNYQWNNRGNVYSVPKPVHGSANGRLPKNVGGGKGGWGRDLILAEDQKEYLKVSDEQRRARKKDLMDEDRLPGILTGDRANAGGRIRVGAGRAVNSKRKH